MQGGLQLAVTSDGGFIATGQHEGNGGNGDCDIYVYRVDLCGNIVWFKLYGTSSQEGGKSIKQTSDGGFVVALGDVFEGPCPDTTKPPSEVLSKLLMEALLYPDMDLQIHRQGLLI
jgi:hypothetical protein